MSTDRFPFDCSIPNQKASEIRWPDFVEIRDTLQQRGWEFELPVPARRFIGNAAFPNQTFEIVSTDVRKALPSEVRKCLIHWEIFLEDPRKLSSNRLERNDLLTLIDAPMGTQVQHLNRAFEKAWGEVRAFFEDIFLNRFALEPGFMGLRMSSDYRVTYRSRLSRFLNNEETLTGSIAPRSEKS